MENIDGNRILWCTVFMLWPLFLIPYLVPTFARISMGLKVWQAFVMPLVIPGVLFLWLLPTYLQDPRIFLPNLMKRSKRPRRCLFLGMLLGFSLLSISYSNMSEAFLTCTSAACRFINPPYKNLGLVLDYTPPH